MAVTITFAGAAGGVTGSKHLLKWGSHQVLLDCGMHQGRPEDVQKFNYRFPFEPSDITDIVLSHGHLDHCGSIPTMVKRGFRGTIWCTPATKDVAYWIMKDSAAIQQMDFEYGRIKCSLTEKECAEPLYTIDDVEESMKYFVTVPYESWKVVAQDFRIKFYDAGHILGSAVCLVELKDLDQIKTIGFSGDLGRENMPILRDPKIIEEPVHHWITESTYGNRVHGDIQSVEKKIVELITKIAKRRGKIIAPTFSLGRTQEIVYILHKLTDRGAIPRIPIFVDSPLAASITGVFSQHLDCVDEETREEFINNHENPFGFRNLTYTRDKAASQLLNTAPGPMIILAASGMANAGRILHHLLHGIEDRNNCVMLTNYMAKHTLGRYIQEKRPVLRIFGQDVNLRAEVVEFNEFSAHADWPALVDYTKKLADSGALKNVFLVHGEQDSALALREHIHDVLPQMTVHIPELFQEFTLS